MTNRIYSLKTCIVTSCAMLFCGLFATNTAAQNHNNSESPYTRFGIGKLGDGASTIGRQMGGLGIGLRQGMYPNPLNPASYTATDSTTFIFDFGISAGNSWQSSSKHTESRTLGNFEYASMLFRVNKFMAMSAGILPYSTAGYQFGSTQQVIGGDIDYSRIYKGSGNLNQVYLGLGVEPFKGLSIGTNMSYLFGDFVHARSVTYNTSSPLNPTFAFHLRLKAIKFDIGAQYSIKLSNNRFLHLGATYSPRSPFKSRYIESEALTQGSTVVSLQQDTINGTSFYALPHSIGFGLSYQLANKLILGADIKYSRWASVPYYKSESKLNDYYRVALGGEWTPRPDGRRAINRMTYRFGLHGENSYVLAPTQNLGLKDYYTIGASFGIGIPLVDRRSSLNLSVEYDRLIPSAKTMVNEQYLRFTVGLTFNEAWFKKLRLN